MKKFSSLAAASLLACGTVLAGCATHIKAPDQPNQPSPVHFKNFARVTIAPLKVERSGKDSGDQAAAKRIGDQLTACMQQVFPQLNKTDVGGKELTIEPAIVDLKKVNTSERIWLGPMAGSSAVVLKTVYKDAASGKVIVEPLFYARAEAFGGGATFGATDNMMLNRVTEDACGYAKSNL